MPKFRGFTLPFGKNSTCCLIFLFNIYWQLQKISFLVIKLAITRYLAIKFEIDLFSRLRKNVVMYILKKCCLILISIFCLAGTCYAQNKNRREQMQNKREERQGRREERRDNRQERRSDRQEQFQNRREERQGRREERRDNRQERRSDRQEQFQNRREERQGRREERRNPG